MPIKVGNTNTGQISWQIREIGDSNTITIDNWRKMSDVLILNNLNSANSINSNYSNLTINYDNKYVVGLINSNYVINQFIDSDGLFTQDEYIISLNKSNINLKNSNINFEFIDKLHIYNKNKDIITSYNHSSIDYNYDINYYLNNNNINYINNLDQNIISINNNTLNIDCDVKSKEIYADKIRPNDETAGITIENFNIKGIKLTDINIGKFNSNVDNLLDKAPLEISINKNNQFINDSIFQVTKYNYHNTNSDFNFEDSNILLKINSSGFLNIGKLSDIAKDSFININNTYNLEASNIVNFEGEYKGDTFTFNKYGNLVLGSNINNLDSIVYINRNDDRLNLDENNIENINLDNPLLKINIDFEEKNNYLWSIQKSVNTNQQSFYKFFNNAFFDLEDETNENTNWLQGVSDKDDLINIINQQTLQQREIYTKYKYNYVQQFTKDSNKLFHTGDTERYYYIIDKELVDYIDSDITKIKLSKDYDVENTQLYNNLYNEFNLKDSTKQIAFNYKTISFINTAYTENLINQTLFYPDKIYFYDGITIKDINLKIIDITDNIRRNRINLASAGQTVNGVDLSHVQLYLYPDYSDIEEANIYDSNAGNYNGIIKTSLIDYLTNSNIFYLQPEDVVNDIFNETGTGYFQRFTNLTYYDSELENYFFTVHTSSQFYNFLKDKNVFSKYDNFVNDIINKPNFYEFTSNNMFISSFTDNGTLVFNEDDYVNPIYNKINYSDIKDFSIYSKQKNAIFDKIHINTLKSQSDNTIDFDNNNIININDLSFSSKSNILINDIKLNNIVCNDPNKEISFINNNINFKLPIYGLVWIKTSNPDIIINYNEITSDHSDYQSLVDLIKTKNLVNDKIYLSYTELSENNLIDKINYNNYIKLNDSDYYYTETIEFNKKNYGEKYKIINASPNENHYYNDIISINSINNNTINPSVAIYGNNPSYLLYSSNEVNNGMSYYSTIKYEGFNTLGGLTADGGQDEKKYIYEISYKNNNTNDLIFEQNNSYHILQHIANDYDMITMGKNYSFCIDNQGINGLTGRKWKYVGSTEPEGKEIISPYLQIYVTDTVINGFNIGQTFELSEEEFLQSDITNEIFKPIHYFKTAHLPYKYYKIVEDNFTEIISNSTNSNFTVSIGVPHKLDAINKTQDTYLYNYPRYFHETLKDSDYMLNIYGNTKISGIDGESVALSVKVNDYKSTDNTYKTNISIGSDAILNNTSNTFTIDGDIYSDKLNYKDNLGNYLNVSNVFVNTVEDITSNIIPHVMSYTYIHTSNLNNNFNTDTDVDNGIFNLNLIPLIPYENFAIPEVPYMDQRVTEYYHIGVDAEGKVNEIEDDPYRYLQEYNDDMLYFRNNDMPFIENNLIDREDRGYHYIVFEGDANVDKTYNLKINDTIQVEYLAVGGGAGGGLIDKKYVGIHWRWRQFNYDNLANYNSNRKAILKVYPIMIDGNQFINLDESYTSDEKKWYDFIKVLNNFSSFGTTGQLNYTLNELDTFFGSYDFGLKWQNKGDAVPTNGIELINDYIKLKLTDTSTDAIITLTDSDSDSDSDIIAKIPKYLNINHYIINNGYYFQPVSDTIRNNLYKTCIFLEESESKYGFYYPSIESGGSGGEIRIFIDNIFYKDSELKITIGKGGQGSGTINYSTVPHDDIISETNIPLQSSGSDTIINTYGNSILINGGGIDIIDSDSTSYTNNFNFDKVGKDIGSTTYPDDIYTLFGFPFDNDSPITYTYGSRDTDTNTNKIFIAGGGGGKDNTGNSLYGGKGGGGGGGDGNAISNSGGGGGFGDGRWGNGASGLIIMRYRFIEKIVIENKPINTDKVKSYLEFDWDNQQWFLNPYVANTSNDIVIRTILTSNQISRNIYNTSNNLISHITQSTSNLLDNIVDTSNYVYDVHTNLSNFKINYQTDYDIIHHNILNLDASFVKTGQLNIDRIPNIPITKFQNLNLDTLYSPKVNDKILELTDHYYSIEDNHYEFIILQYNPNPDYNDGNHTNYTVEFQTDCEINVIIVGGGGAGGSEQVGGGAGGGGGGFIELRNLKIIRGTKEEISVGRGGDSSSFAVIGDGEYSSAFECTAYGGLKPDAPSGSVKYILEGGTKGEVDKSAVESPDYKYKYNYPDKSITLITNNSDDTGKGGYYIVDQLNNLESDENYDTVQDNIHGKDGIYSEIFINRVLDTTNEYLTHWGGGGGAARKYNRDSSDSSISNYNDYYKYGNEGNGGNGGGGPGAGNTVLGEEISDRETIMGGEGWIKTDNFKTTKTIKTLVQFTNNQYNDSARGGDGLSGTGGGGGGGYNQGGNGGSGIVIIRINNKEDGETTTKVIPEKGDRQKGYLSFNYNSFSWQMNPLDAINLDFNFDTIYSNIVNISNNLAIDINERLYNSEFSSTINPRIITNGSFADHTIEAKHIFGFNNERFANGSDENADFLYELSDTSYTDNSDKYYNYLLKGSKLMSRSITNNNFVDNTITADKIDFPISASKLALTSIRDDNIEGTINYPVKIVPSNGNSIDISKFNNAYIDIDSLTIQNKKFDGTMFITSNENSISKINLNNLSNIIIDIDSLNTYTNTSENSYTRLISEDQNKIPLDIFTNLYIDYNLIEGYGLEGFKFNNVNLYNDSDYKIPQNYLDNIYINVEDIDEDTLKNTTAYLNTNNGGKIRPDLIGILEITPDQIDTADPDKFFFSRASVVTTTDNKINPSILPNVELSPDDLDFTKGTLNDVTIVRKIEDSYVNPNKINNSYINYNHIDLTTDKLINVAIEAELNSINPNKLQDIKVYPNSINFDFVSGLEWYELDSEPSFGSEINNLTLNALLTQNPSLSFTQAEWETTGIIDLNKDNYVSTNGKYYKPKRYSIPTNIITDDNNKLYVSNIESLTIKPEQINNLDVVGARIILDDSSGGKVDPLQLDGTTLTISADQLLTGYDSKGNAYKFPNNIQYNFGPNSIDPQLLPDNITITFDMINASSANKLNNVIINGNADASILGTGIVINGNIVSRDLSRINNVTINNSVDVKYINTANIINDTPIIGTGKISGITNIIGSVDVNYINNTILDLTSSAKIINSKGNKFSGTTTIYGNIDASLINDASITIGDTTTFLSGTSISGNVTITGVVPATVIGNPVEIQLSGGVIDAKDFIKDKSIDSEKIVDNIELSFSKVKFTDNSFFVDANYIKLANATTYNNNILRLYAYKSSDNSWTGFELPFKVANDDISFISKPFYSNKNDYSELQLKSKNNITIFEINSYNKNNDNNDIIDDTLGENLDSLITGNHGGTIIKNNNKRLNIFIYNKNDNNHINAMEFNKNFNKSFKPLHVSEIHQVTKIKFIDDSEITTAPKVLNDEDKLVMNNTDSGFFYNQSDDGETGAGFIHCNGIHAEFNITAYSLITASDLNLKTDIKQLDLNIDNILRLNPISFKWKDSAKNNIDNFGFIAQELEELFPELITNNGNNYKAVNYIGLIPHLVKHIQNLETRLQKLEKNL
jgi:hypothetical protein